MSDDNSNGSNGSKGKIEDKAAVKALKLGDIKNGFKTPGTSNVSDHLVIPGDDPLGIAMRSILTPHNLGSRLAVAYTQDWIKCVRFKSILGQQRLLMLMALNTSINGESRKQLVEAIIGDKRFRSNTGFVDKLKGLYGQDKAAKE